MMMGWETGWHWGWMPWGGLFMLLFWGGLLALIIFALRGLTDSGNAGGNRGANESEQRLSHQTPLEILQTRYAKGEIEREEYEQMRRELQAPLPT